MHEKIKKMQLIMKKKAESKEIKYARHKGWILFIDL